MTIKIIYTPLFGVPSKWSILLSECAILKNLKNQSFKLVHSIYWPELSSRPLLASRSTLRSAFGVLFSRTPVEHICSPARLDTIMKSLRNSPKPLFPVESRTPPASQGFSTFSEETEIQKDAEVGHPQPQAADFSLLEFGEDVETKDSSPADKTEVFPVSDIAETSQDAKSQNSMQTFGYQQRMNFNVDQGFGFFQQKPGRNKKKKKKWNQMQNYFQQKERSVQGSGDVKFGNFNMNSQSHFGQQQGMTQWRGPSQGIQNVTQNYQGNQFFCGGPVGLDQGPRPQNMAPGNFVGNFSQQGPSFPNFNVPPPNIPPMDFFRKVPPPNFPQQNQALMMQQLQQNPLLLQQTVPPPPLQANQPPFFPPNQQSPYNRLPPPPPFQSNVPTPPASQFPQTSDVQQQQLPQGNQTAFPSQQNQFPAFNSPTAPHVDISPTKQLTPQAKFPMPRQHQGDPSEAMSHSEVESFPAVTTSSLETYKSRDESEPCTPPPVKHKQTQLPPHWKSATDPQGKVYYYHTQTR